MTPSDPSHRAPGSHPPAAFGTPLTTLLGSSDFAGAVNALADDFRRKEKLPSIHQLGFVVADVDAAAEELEACGVQSFYVLEGNTSEWTEHGESRSVRGRIALSYHRGYELELIEPAKGTDFYQAPPEHLISFHHLGFRVEDVEKPSQKLSAAGYPVMVQGRLDIGPLAVEFAYHDTAKQAGLVMEFISWTIFGRTFSPQPDLWRRETLEKLIRRRR